MQTQFDTDNRAGHGSRCSHLPLEARKQNLILSAIAMLSDYEIQLMSRKDLLDALRMARTAWPRSDGRNVDNLDTAELKRLLAIVREYFRKQVNWQSTAKTWSPEFN